MVVDVYKVNVMKYKLWVQQYFSPIYTVLLVVIHSSKNKMQKFDDFALPFDEI